MAKYLLLAPTAPKPDRDDEYNDWYDTVHLADVLALPGVVSGKRYEVAPQSPAQPPSPYLAIYEIETDDPTATFAEMGRRAKAGEMAISPALDVSSAALWLFQPR